jgi:putative nucleotidyltransferase with HDIG domain
VATLAVTRPPVLVVDDDVAFARLVADLLSEQGYRTDTAHDHAQATDCLSHREYAVAVIDLVLPGVGGLELSDRIRAENPDTQILILTGHGSLPSAVGSLRRGIFDYLQKAEVDLDRLARTVDSAVERWHLLRENRRLVAGLKESNARLTSLHDAIARLGGQGHVDRTLDELVQSARSLLGAQRARAVLLEAGAEGTLLVTHACGDEASLLEGVRLHPQDGLVAHVVASRQGLLLERAAADGRYTSRSDELDAEHPGFLCVPIVHGQILGALAVAGRVNAFADLDRQLAESLATQAATALDNAAKNERALNFFTHTCDLLVKFLDLKDVNLAGHSLAVAALTDMLTRRLGLPDEERRVIHFGALLHDIGKLRLEPELLHARHALEPEQLLAMQEHAVLGVELLRPISHWHGVLPLIQAHHERWDGGGYPNGLAGEDIPLGARIISVADAFDAITRGYPGRPQRTVEQSLAELIAHAGTQFDPELVKVFVEAYRDHGPL